MSFAVVDCVWNEFGAWNPCNVTCGGGTSFRERTVRVHAHYDGQDCPGEGREDKECNLQGCPGIDDLLHITNFP